VARRTVKVTETRAQSPRGRSRWSSSRAAAAAVGIATLFGAERPAFAQDPADLPPPPGAQPGLTEGIEQSARRPFWVSGDTRWFVSAVLEAGIVYLRPQIAVGYGKPHWQWIGVEGYSGVSINGGVEYGGLRAVSRYVDGRVGARYNFSVNQDFLLPDDEYTREDSELELGPQSRYLSFEAELTGSVPVPGGNLFAVATGYAIVDTPPGYYVYEESLHVIVDPPYLWRTRLGYLASFGIDDTLKVGAAVELIGNPGRDAFVLRTGPVLAVSLTHHLEAVGALMIVALTPDDLGLRGAEFGQLGFRYRWATGDRWPEFP
jgi:hypothetical protein